MKAKVYEHTYLDVRNPKFSFDQIAGYASVKEKFNDMIVVPLVYPEVLERAGITPPTGVVVWGPLGTGKGHMIEAAAGEAGVSYVIIRGRECTDHPRVIRDGFKFAVENRPCVLHLMDIDWLCPRKDVDYAWDDSSTSGKPDKFGSDEVHRAVHEEVEKVASMPDVIVAASCYRIDVLDQAFTRTSMLGRKIYVPRPGEEDRLEIFKYYLKDAKLPSVDLKKLVKQTEYYVGWDIEALCRKAKLHVLGKDNDSVVLSADDLEYALGKVRPWLTPVMVRGYDKIYGEDCIHKYNF
ncbi:MAG: AAA family ATPase [Candidatus Hydrothermarchaeales archaeon]